MAITIIKVVLERVDEHQGGTVADRIVAIGDLRCSRADPTTQDPLCATAADKLGTLVETAGVQQTRLAIQNRRCTTDVVYQGMWHGTASTALDKRSLSALTAIGRDIWRGCARFYSRMILIGDHPTMVVSGLM